MGEWPIRFARVFWLVLMALTVVLGVLASFQGAWDRAAYNISLATLMLLLLHVASEADDA